jgi:hypothetical protein
MTVAALPNVVGASLVQLRSFTELTTLCGGPSAPRINGAKRTAWNPMPRTAILVTSTGGPSAGEWADINRLQARIDLRCYGSNPLTAYTLWMMAHACFCPSRGSGLRRAFTQITCRVEDVAHLAGPYSEVEPDTLWPFTWASYMVRYLETPV